MRVAHNILLFLILVVFASCSIPPVIDRTDCVVPEPVCKPGASSAVGVDTTKLYPGNYKYHIDLLPAPVNSSTNDNSIAFLPGLNSLISAEKENVQRLYTSPLFPDLQFGEIQVAVLEKTFEHVGAASYCPADKKLYFTAKAPNNDPNDYDLYSGTIAQRGSEVQLSNITSLSGINKTINFEGQPAISTDGLRIIFASDRAGGYGGVDLYYSSRETILAQWQEPKNMGGIMNTACDELSPSFSSNEKKLYFASNGHETIGGYDIFSVSLDRDAHGGAENLGTPINTPSDEIFPYELSDSQFFYASNQPARFSGRNLFVLRRTKYYDVIGLEMAENTPFQTIELKGRVDIPRESESLPEVFVRDVGKDIEIARKQTDTAGNYSFNVEKGREYDVGAEIKDKFYDVHRVDLRRPTDSIVTVAPLSVPDTLILRINFPFDDYSNPYDFIIDEDGGKTETRWQSSMDLLAKSIQNSSAALEKVLLYGHTDSLGTDEYNTVLARRRADFVAKQLQARGISSKILSIVPKGRTLPVVRNPSESDDTFYLRCRRVEFIKVFKKERSR